MVNFIIEKELDFNLISLWNLSFRWLFYFRKEIMELNGFQKMLDKDKQNIGGAGIPIATITSAVSMLPTITNSFASIAGTIKSMFSNSGEIKTKELSVKWDNPQPKEISSKITPVYFVY